MFSFGKNKDTINITDVVYIKATAKWQACMEAHKKDAAIIFIAWFEETLQQLQTFFKGQYTADAQLILYRQVSNHLLNNHRLIFVEHYPLQEKENLLFTSLNLKEATIFSSLDEPLFQYFGGERMIEILQKTGVNENESLQHPLITNALKNAQEKIAKKVTLEQNALSQSDWFKRNMKD